MSPCLRCGAPAGPDATLCSACGLDLAATRAAAPPWATPPSAVGAPAGSWGTTAQPAAPATATMPAAPWAASAQPSTPAWLQQSMPSADPPGRLSGRIAMVGLAVAAVTSLLTIALVLPLLETATWRTGDFDVAAVEQVDAFAVAIALVIAVTYLTWLWRVTSAYQGLTGSAPVVGRIGAVGWTFVPIANLVMPAVVLWKLVTGYAIPGRRRLAWLVPVWWFAYVAANVGTFAWSMRIDDLVSSPRFQPQELARATGTLISSEILSMVAALALIAAIRRVERTAGTRARARSLGWPHPSPMR